jgi:RimJ/RimL family protein N-acetyltransferase
MRHSLIAENFGIRLRPVCLEDANFIVWLRHLKHAEGKIGDSAADVAGQRAWLEDYFLREGDYYFIIETTNSVPLGTVGVYDISGGSGECGRYITRPGVFAAVPAIVLTGDLAFGPMGLKELRATAVTSNRTIRKLMPKMGFHQVAIKPGDRSIGGRAVDMVHMLATPEEWAKRRERIAVLSARAARQIGRWQEAQSSTENQPETHVQFAS